MFGCSVLTHDNAFPDSVVSVPDPAAVAAAAVIVALPVNVPIAKVPLAAAVAAVADGVADPVNVGPAWVPDEAAVAGVIVAVPVAV